MSLTNKLSGKIAASALLVGIAALAAYDQSVQAQRERREKANINADLINERKVILSDERYIPRFVLKCYTAGNWKDFETYIKWKKDVEATVVWENDNYWCEKIDLPAKVGPISL